MQALTPALEAILKDKFQARAQGFTCRVEVDTGGVVGAQALVASTQKSSTGASTGFALPEVDTAVEPVQLIAFVSKHTREDQSDPAGWTRRESVAYLEVSDRRHTMIDMFSSSNAAPYGGTCTTTPAAYWTAAVVAFRAATGTTGVSGQGHTYYPGGTGVNPTETAPLSGPTTANAVLVGFMTRAGTPSTPQEFAWPEGWEVVEHLSSVSIGGHGVIGAAEVAIRTCDGTETEVQVQALGTDITNTTLMVGEYGILVNTISGRPSRVELDKSLRMVADQASIQLPNEGLALGWGPDSLIPTNARVRVYQAYGGPDNEVCAFTGLVDEVHDERDVLTTTLACRDMFALLIDQTFGATAPQAAGEAGTVRTLANGVYLSLEVDQIVSDILDRAGWPSADRDITPTSYVLDEYVIEDGWSWAEAIVGEDRLTGMVGYDAWADELGIFHFAPTYSAGALTEPGEPVYTYRTGEDILALEDNTDQYDLRTRVKVRGPLTTQVLSDTWRQLWKTNKFSRPVGLWYDPSDSANLRVLDRGTKRLYKLRQSDRAVLSSTYLGSVIAHPLGLSGDPADATIYWVLNAPWIDGGSGGNSVKKVRKSDNHVLASYSLPSGRWSAIKVSAANMWLTNLDTDRFYKRSKADASAVADYRHKYGGTSQANPSGLMVDGTTLYLFWANSGTTARFLVCDESAPNTITKVVKTAGTTLHGGEMDTTTHIHCYGDSDSLGLVAKFTLAKAEDQTSEVFEEVVDTDLEDELGALAQGEPRVHDSHPGDAAHPYEVRRLTVDLEAVTSLAQATETASRQLDKLAQRRRTLDTGVVGNPALQKNDLVRIEDPVTGLALDGLVDTYRSSMDASGTYVGTLALLPVTQPDDTPTDDGDAT